MRCAIAVRDADLHLNVLLDVPVDCPITVAYWDGWFDGFGPEAVDADKGGVDAASCAARVE